VNLVSIIAILSTQSGLNLQVPGDMNSSNRIVFQDQYVGNGKLIEAGDKITIEYRVWAETNRELADSKKRGLPFTLIVGARNSDPFVSVALPGMHAGGIRTAVIPADFAPEGVGSIIPAKTDLHLWIYVIAAKPTNLPKVDSIHAERTQGTLEVPRTSARDGRART